MSEQDTEIQSLYQRWGAVAPTELSLHKLKFPQSSLEGFQQIIKCIWKRGWSVTVEYFDLDDIQVTLNLNTDGPQYVSSNFDITLNRKETDALKGILMVYVAALEESLIRV
jgi:hypothetical protein